MNAKQKTYIGLLAIIAGLLFGTAACFLLSPEQALATYSDIDPHTALTPKSKDGGSPIFDAAVDMLRAVTTGVLLPAGLVFFTWRTVYLAIFPLMLQVDPLDMTQSARYSTSSKYAHQKAANAGIIGKRTKNLFSRNNQGTASDTLVDNEMEQNGSIAGYHDKHNPRDLPKVAEACLKLEVKTMFQGILIVGLTWTIIQLVITGVAIFLQLAQSF